MDLDQRPEDVILYRMEYLDNGVRIVDWLWLTELELDSRLEDLAQVAGLIYRAATSEEEELYDEAYRDGYEVAYISEIHDRYDGITFRVDKFDAENGDLQTTKMFECASCEKHRDFENEVGMSSGMYLAAIKNDKLWHLCYECAQGNAEINWLSDGWMDTE